MTTELPDIPVNIRQTFHAVKYPPQPRGTLHKPAKEVRPRARLAPSYPLSDEQPAKRKMDAIPAVGYCLPIRFDEAFRRRHRIDQRGRSWVRKTEGLPSL